MQAPNHWGNSAMMPIPGFCHQPQPESESCLLTHFQIFNNPHHLMYNNAPPHHANNQTSCKTPSSYCCSTLESSSSSSLANNSTFDKSVYNNSPSNVSFSSNETPISQLDTISHPCCEHQQNHSPENNTSFAGSPISSSTVTHDVSELKYKLMELETAMLGPDPDLTDCNINNNRLQNEPPRSVSSQKNYNRHHQVMEMITQRDLKGLLIACAKAISEHDLSFTKCLINELRQLVSVSGEPIQRLGAYLLEGLVARLAKSGSSICKSLRCKEPERSDLLSCMQILYEVCPYIKFGYMSANGAIAEAMKNQQAVHIIDFQIGQGSQWVTLIQAFAARPGGPPQIRVTGIDDPYSAYARGGGLQIIGRRLERLARSFRVPFEFQGLALSPIELDRDNLRIRPGEALVINFAFTLHHMPDESVSTENQRDQLLRMVRSLSPKVVTLVEQECNTNSAAFFPRFLETLDYYAAVFESMDVTLARDHKDRINVEQHCLARDVVNLIACEGAERLERHELLGKWRLRFAMAGFRPYPLSSLVNTTIKTLLKNYSQRYRLEEKDGALYLGWMNRNLVASCAWQC